MNPPNILFAISDDQSFPHAGAYGCDWVKTPAFDRVAEEGLLFTNCYTPNAKCAPSRSAIITGRNSWQLEEAGNHVSIFPAKYNSFCEVLERQTNYFVGFTGKGVEPVNPQGRLLTGKAYNNMLLKPIGKGISPKDYTENFKQFILEKPAGKPFFFWYGGHEPHREYQYGIGAEKAGKSISDIDSVPGFWPDNEVVRNDMLDYAFEIEHFDNHLGKMIAYLEEIGELDNTIILVTADNGMPFPRCKGIEYEYSNHLPLAIMWPEGIEKPGRKISDYISFIDFVPTFIDLTEIENPDMQPVQGKSLLPILKSDKEGQVIPERNYVLLGQERHDVGRPNDEGYPVRSILKEGLLYVHNFKPDRWPMCNPETGYLNTDGSPTKTQILDLRRNNDDWYFWNLCFATKGSEELYNVKEDSECLNNLIDNPDYQEQKNKLKDQLFRELKEQKDPRMFGNGDVFDHYLYAHEAQRNFYNRYMNGEIKDDVTSWVNKSDYETKPVIVK
ncbi:MAG: sulfatase [Bacteroidales bacterium]|nr:sulfatase [Bacteroidales bacterium]MCF8392065.1 sulfatase [Bacteroidales bacterium]